MRTRWSAYAGVSAALAGGVVIKALAQRPNFYSASVYLSQSSANLMILSNFIFVAACSLLLGLQKLLYGPLRPIEIEQLYEKAWFAVTETCLAMTIFRGEIGAWFLVMFFALLAGKVWAWIGEGRVEILEQQPPRNPRLFHTRLALSLGLSVSFNLTMLEYVVKQVMHMARPDMMVMFGFEFAVLSIVSLSTASRYAINLVEIAIVRQQKTKRIEEMKHERVQAAIREAEQTAEQNPTSEEGVSSATPAANGTSLSPEATEAAQRATEVHIDEQEIEVEGWEGKGRWIFYLDLTTDFFKLVVYLSFFFILLIFYGLPIHILRDVYMTFRSFFKRIGDFMRYRTATRDMNARYPDATEQDIGREDVCIICREDMRPYQPPANGERANPLAERMRPKKLPCGHVLHFSCLRSWLERQQICPTCRTNVVTRNTTRNGTNNGAAGGAPAQHGNPQPADRPAARVYQLGPLRIGLGAGRGNNMLEDLQQQLGDGQPRPNAQPNADGPQQYGFGIRWDGLRRRNRTERGQRSIQRQLDDVQRHINQEYRALGQMTQELRLLQNMEAQLARLRSQRQGGTMTPVPNGLAGQANITNVAALTGDLSRIVPAGSDQLPAGLTLPEGWTLMPLHQTQTPIPLPGGVPLGQPFPPNVFGTPHGPGMPAFPPGFPTQIPALPPHMRQPTQIHQPQTIDVGRTVNHTLSQPTETQPGLPNREPQVPVAATNASQTLNQADASRTEDSLRNQPSANGTSVENADPAPVNGTTTARTIDGQQPQPSSAQASGITGRSVRESSVETPVESMFTLPTWGSAPAENSVTNGNHNTSGGEEMVEGEQTDGPRRHTKSNNSTPESSTAHQQDKNPTVEDLVEEPD